ncbi:hypothetical protein R2R70_16350 [Cobetia sp. SIMBA_158]|uniref:hypothetical protein n=1 Tax=Cobetia sp. SIMBA_158 TaxID=3081617 RepID=UPI00397F1179
MRNIIAISHALGRLANAMRLYNEAFICYKSLAGIDYEEAIHNLDRAFEQKLECFHSLYDVSKGEFDFNAHPETNLLINVRNAIHHRNHDLFHSILQTTWLDRDPEYLLGAEFLIARHRTIGGFPPPPMHLIKLDDIYLRLDPRVESCRLTTKAGVNLLPKFLFLEEGLSFNKIWTKAEQERYPRESVYLDMLPIFISAISKVFIALDKAKIPFCGFDANTYKSVFIDELRTDLDHFDYYGFIINEAQIAAGPKLTIQEVAIKRGCTY